MIRNGCQQSSVSKVLDEKDNCPYIDGVRIEWDPRKAEANLREHGVSFAEAATVLTAQRNFYEKSHR